MFVVDRSRPLTNPGLFDVFDWVRTIDVKYLLDIRKKHSVRWFDGGDLRRPDAVTLRVGKIKLRRPKSWIHVQIE